MALINDGFVFADCGNNLKEYIPPAPKGRTMGHAGAIVGGKDDTAAAKMEIMRQCGIHVVESPAVIGEMMAKVLKGEL